MLIAACITTGLVASATGATEAEPFHSLGEPTVITGVQKGAAHVISFTEKEAKCAKVTATGTLAKKTQKTLTLDPVYSECSFGGLKGSEVHMNGCAYVFTATVEAGMDDHSGNFEIECPKDKQIELTAIVAGVHICTIDIGPQTLPLITYKNEGNNVNLTWIVLGIKFNLTEVANKDCGTPGIHEGGLNGATLNGSMLLEGKVGGVQKKFWVT